MSVVRLGVVAFILWANVRHERRQAWCCGLEPIFESSGRRKVRRMAMFALQESVCWSETYFREQHAFYGQVASVQHERRQAWWCGLEPIFESSGRRKVRRMAMFALQESVCWSETYFREQHAFYGQVASVQHERRQAWCCGLEPIFESSGRRKVRRMAMFALQESVCSFYGQMSGMSAVRLGVVVWSLFSRAAAGRKFVAWPCLRFKKAFVGLKPIFESSMHFMGKCPA